MDSAPPSAMGFTFPPSPESVPPDLAKPTSKYRLHAWLAFCGLTLFGLIYLTLVLWFGYSTFRLFGEATEQGGFLLFIESFGAAILTIFLVKGLFFKKHTQVDNSYEVTKEDEPVLFAFLNQLAADVGAPRPHKVFLSPTVNACVFYDLSLLNFLIPTKKNLDIGLGLVNVLTLSEFKAVLSHEFGHFAQKTMAVGRWVYVAQQVANQLIYHRDALDKFLGVLSSLDLRIAWIGWLLQLIVWSLRSILDSLLSFVMLAERALSREMEFQADLVAVSATGSDALIHGLFRLPAADQAWSETLDFMGEELGQDRKVANAFVVQKKILAHKQRILDDPNFGDVPPLPESNRESNRIFSADIAQPPQMWATHPLSHFREANAKERYVPADLDDRDAWDVFLDRDKLGTDLTSHMLKGMEQKLAPLGETIQRLDEKYDKEYYQPKYRGIYLDRSLCDHAKTPSDLLTQGGIPENVSLYPESLVEDLEKLRNTQKEKAMLVALRDRTFESSDGVIRFRGEVIKRARLGNAIEITENDIENCRQRLCEHDRVCRSLHMEIARSQPGDWAPYLTGLLEAIHYADHKLRDAIDANRKLSNTYAVVIADGNVSNNEVQRLVVDASNLYSVIREVYEQRATVYLDPTILQGMKKDSWSDLFEKEFRLPSPNGGNIGDWLNAIDGWVGEVCHAMSLLHEEALEQLLKTEAMLSAVAAGTMEPGQAPKPSMFPKTYRTLLHGEERDLQKKLGWWDSFQTASGIGPATLRFCVAAVIVGAAIYVTFPPAWRYWIESFLGVSAY